jgi:hypothetical protein
LRLRYSLTLAAAALSLFAIPPLAGGAVITVPRTTNLDDDPLLEQVIPQEVCLPPGAAVVPPCAPDQFTQRQVVIADSCNGTPYTRVVSAQHEAVIKLVVSNFQDITPRPEIFFDLRSGAGGRAGEIRIVSWQEGPTVGCQEPRTLFRYPSKYTRGRVPRKARSLDTFDATLRDVSKSHAGKELRLRETYVDRNDALCCPSFERITLFGYNAGMDLYVKFRTTVKRIRKK